MDVDGALADQLILRETGIDELRSAENPTGLTKKAPQ